MFTIFNVLKFKIRAFFVNIETRKNAIETAAYWSNKYHNEVFNKNQITERSEKINMRNASELFKIKSAILSVCSDEQIKKISEKIEEMNKA